MKNKIAGGFEKSITTGVKVKKLGRVLCV